MLNSQSPIPLYHQLADIITDQIRSGEYQAGDLIPSETGIAKDYGIGRPTVRQAMDLLVRKGLIERKRGSGTFVKEQNDNVDLFSLAGTSQAFITKGIQTESKILKPVVVTDVSDKAGNPFNNKKAYFFSRLTFVDKDPVLLEDIYLNSQLFKGLEKIDFENSSLSMVVADQYYLKPETGHQSFKLAILSGEQAELLDLGSSGYLLEVERCLDFPDNPAAIFSRLYCRTDKFAFSQTINLNSM